MLSAMAHGQDTEPERALRVALAAIAASAGLDAERSTLYYDLVVVSLHEVARKALEAMDPSTYTYQSEFAKQYFSRGKAEGMAGLVTRQLTTKFRRVSAAARRRVAEASVGELERYAERLLTAETVDEVFAER